MHGYQILKAYDVTRFFSDTRHKVKHFHTCNTRPETGFFLILVANGSTHVST